MLGNSSFSQTGATPKDPIQSINSFLNKKFGVPLPKTPVQKPAPVQGPLMSMVPQGTNPGQSLAINNSQSSQNALTPGQFGAPAQPTLQTDLQGNKYAPPKPNPSVLEQQRLLNKQFGAGLVEDGITGPKTREAIAKYLTSGGSQQSAPQAQPQTQALQQQAPPQQKFFSDLPEVPKVEKPPLTVAGQVPGLIQAGQQTENERNTQRRLEEAGAITEWEEAIKAGKSVEEANKRLSDFRLAVAEKYGDIESTPIPLEFQQGRQQALARQYASQESALQSGVTNALQNQQQMLTAAQAQAARQQQGAQGAFTGAQTQAQRQAGAQQGAVTALGPQFPSYGSQIIQPGLLGQSGGQMGASLESDVANVVQRLLGGTMSYNDAVSALSGYGQGGLSALQRALPPGFNIAQSNTLAGQQGSINVNYQLADVALNNVENIIKSLGALQKTNVPLINKGANWISTQFGLGSKETREMTGAVQSLRNAYASLLASVKGGTPTDYSSQAIAEIPNEPTPNDIAAIRANFEVLGQARKDILGNPGQAGGTSGGSTGGGFGWDALNY